MAQHRIKRFITRKSGVVVPVDWDDDEEDDEEYPDLWATGPETGIPYIVEDEDEIAQARRDHRSAAAYRNAGFPTGVGASVARAREGAVAHAFLNRRAPIQSHYQWSASRITVVPPFGYASTGSVVLGVAAPSVEADLPTRISAPLQGWKLCRFHMDHTGQWWFSPMAHMDRLYRAEARAYCENQHHAPHPSCECGFYVAVSPWLLPSHFSEGSYGLLRVEVSGRIVRHGPYYRAQHQRVMAVFLREDYYPYSGGEIPASELRDSLGTEVHIVPHDGGEPVPPFESPW